MKAHSWKIALGLLAAATLVLALMSEILTDALEPATKQLGINDVFAGIILLSSVSNISGIMNAVVFARKNQMDLAVSSVIGAATQIALLVAPALVLASLLLPRPMDLLFSRLELVALFISVLTARNMTVDGKSDWLEGAMLIAVFRDAQHWVFLCQLTPFFCCERDQCPTNIFVKPPTRSNAQLAPWTSSPEPPETAPPTRMRRRPGRGTRPAFSRPD